jgi:peptidoglycan LD-endopeptidase CwlK
MYKFSRLSLQKLQGVHPDLLECVKRVMNYQIIDFMVSDGVRSMEAQREYFKAGTTKTMKSKHLIQPDGFGHAVDLYPHPTNWARIQKSDAREIIRFGVLAGLMLKSAQEMGIKIRWGADWDGDGETLDHSFFDAPHYELVT